MRTQHTEAGPLSGRLFERLDKVVGCLGRAGAPLGYDPDDPRTLSRWFRIMWHVVRASVPLLEEARDRARNLTDAAFSAQLVRYYDRHIDEERDHDAWLMEDLSVLGVRGSTLRMELPPAPISAMVGSQYYLVRHVHPALLLGYMALLEGYSAPIAAVRRLREASQAPNRAWRTYEYHAAEDPDHRRDLCCVIDAVPAARPTLGRALIINALRTADWYQQALEAVGPARALRGATQ